MQTQPITIMDFTGPAPFDRLPLAEQIAEWVKAVPEVTDMCRARLERKYGRKVVADGYRMARRGHA